MPLNLIDSDLAKVVPRSDKNLAYDDWRETCLWIKQHTDPQACFLTPRMSATLRWYADRAEAGNWKDIPQNSAGIVEWWNRMLDFHTLARETPPKWLDSMARLGPVRLNALAKTYHVQYAIVPLGPDIPPLPEPPVFASTNKAYAVYRLPLTVPSH